MLMSCKQRVEGFSLEEQKRKGSIDSALENGRK